MAQNPFLIDQVQIEPGTAGSRLVRKATADGSLQFVDPSNTTGITLSQLAGIQSIANILTVGKSGAGAEYNTIQEALDAIPASSSETNPYFVLVGPGVYQETLNFARDGVIVQGFGAVLQSLAEATPNGDGAYHTVVIQAALGTIPKLLMFRDLYISNVHNGYACIRATGGAASEVLSNGLYLHNCQLVASAVGGNRPIWADSINHIYVQGGDMRDSGALSLCLFDNCAGVWLRGTRQVPAMQVDIDNTGTLPSEDIQGAYLDDCFALGYQSTLAPPLAVTFTGEGGTFTMNGCTGSTPDATFSGDQSVVVQDCELGDITLTTCPLTISGTTYGTLAGNAGSTVVMERDSGTAAFVAAATADVTFPVSHLNNSFQVCLETPSQVAGGVPPWITDKLATGFTINFAQAQTMTVGWNVTRKV
jgi:hypothetical protein